LFRTNALACAFRSKTTLEMKTVMKSPTTSKIATGT